MTGLDRTGLDTTRHDMTRQDKTFKRWQMYSDIRDLIFIGAFALVAIIGIIGLIAAL
ncbi:MAG: hypothetical protein ABIH23_29675 [bacterium]